jgi:hypothetical protein
MKILSWLFVILLISQLVLAQTDAKLVLAEPQPNPLSLVVAPVSVPQVAEKLTTLPLDKGLPVIVRVGVYYHSITAFDESAGTFTGTIDSRLRWEDSRLRYLAAETPQGFKEYRGSAADEQLQNIWSPGVAFTNLIDTPSYQVTNVRIFPDGGVEVMQRTTAKFMVKMDAGNFPFDRQTLPVEVEIRKETTNETTLVVLQEDLDFSRAARDIELDGWQIGLVNVQHLVRPGWYGEFHSALAIELGVKRQAAKVAPTIFIPLTASLFIPLVALWMNSLKNGEFQIEAFELANVIVGGLFAMIALNFTINSAYPIIASGDNTVTRLFALNYVTLGVALLIVIFMYRFRFFKRLFGVYIQKEIFLFLLWAVPVLSLGTLSAFILLAVVS